MEDSGNNKPGADTLGVIIILLLTIGIIFFKAQAIKKESATIRDVPLQTSK